MPDRMHKAHVYAEHGYGLILAEYPGYGGQAGSISEKRFYKSASLAMKWLSEKHGVENIVIYGESIGTGVATEMAKEYPKAKALVLEAGFSSAADVGQDIYPFLPVRYLMSDRYESAEKIPEIKMPIFMFHGDQDHVIPLKFAQKLQAASNGHAELKIIKGAGHNNLYDFGAADLVMAFMQSHMRISETEKPPLSE